MLTAIQLWLAMGGYGAYVWSAYGIAFVVILLNVLKARQHYQRAKHIVGERDV